LSKGLLAGEENPERCYLQDGSHYEEREIELRLGTKATALDLGSRQVNLSNGETLVSNVRFRIGKTVPHYNRRVFAVWSNSNRLTKRESLMYV